MIGVVIAKLSSLGVLKRTGDLPQNVNYAIKSNYLLELASTVDGLYSKLSKPRVQPFPDLEQLGTLLSRSVGQVIAETTEGAETSVVSSARATSTVTFPRVWKSLKTGGQFSIRLDEPYLQWMQLSNVVSTEWVASQGEAKRVADNLYSGEGRATYRNLVTGRTCTISANFTFSTVTPRRIEGYRFGPSRWAWDSCSAEAFSRDDFVWVPLGE